MKLGLLSDAHVSPSNHFREISSILPDRAGVDVMVLLGDIGHYGQIFEIAKHVRDQLECTVIFVPGNHEYYSFGQLRPSILEIEALWTKQFDAVEDMHLLIDSDVSVGGVSFFGSTWWSNMGSMYEREMFKLNESMFSDFNYIVHRLDKNQRPVILSSGDLPMLNSDARTAYTKWVRQDNGAKKVFLSHFPMLNGLQHPHYPRSVYFVSQDDEFIIDHKPDLICFGHTHWNFDKSVHDIRCVSNMYGYTSEEGGIGYRKDLVIEL